MPIPKHVGSRMSDRDLDFLIETAHPRVTDRGQLRQILREDEGFRNSVIEDEKIFQRVMDEEEAFLRISPALFFEILLRKTIKALEKTSYTFEKTSTMKVPVFDTKEVVDLLARESFIGYLADMLSSFTKIESYRVSFRVRKGLWVRLQFSDLDIHSLMSFAEAVDEEHRFGIYKRIGDICLFILGIFPDYAEREYRYPFSRELRPPLRGKLGIGPEDYEKEGKKFYRLAAEHPAARGLELADIFWTLHGNFVKAKKPLNFIADHYLQYKRHKFFG